MFQNIPPSLRHLGWNISTGVYGVSNMLRPRSKDPLSFRGNFFQYEGKSYVFYGYAERRVGKLSNKRGKSIGSGRVIFQTKIMNTKLSCFKMIYRL
jgi:hypothetical protein